MDLVLDTQVTEYQVLEGASKAMEENKISLIYLEIITKPTYKGQKNFDEILFLLRKMVLNYTTFIITVLIV